MGVSLGGNLWVGGAPATSIHLLTKFISLLIKVRFISDLFIPKIYFQIFYFEISINFLKLIQVLSNKIMTKGEADPLTDLTGRSLG